MQRREDDQETISTQEERSIDHLRDSSSLGQKGSLGQALSLDRGRPGILSREQVPPLHWSPGLLQQVLLLLRWQLLPQVLLLLVGLGGLGPLWLCLVAVWLLLPGCLTRLQPMADYAISSCISKLTLLLLGIL